MDITCITIDCHEPAAVAAFWNEALHWGGVAASGDGGGAVCGPPDGGIYLEFIRVPEDKPKVKNRMHPGCGVASLAGLGAEIERNGLESVITRLETQGAERQDDSD